MSDRIAAPPPGLGLGPKERLSGYIVPSSKGTDLHPAARTEDDQRFA